MHTRTRATLELGFRRLYRANLNQQAHVPAEFTPPSAIQYFVGKSQGGKWQGSKFSAGGRLMVQGGEVGEHVPYSHAGNS
jgi:hypothetical protein